MGCLNDLRFWRHNTPTLPPSIPHMSEPQRLLLQEASEASPPGRESEPDPSWDLKLVPLDQLQPGQFVEYITSDGKVARARLPTHRPTLIGITTPGLKGMIAKLFQHVYSELALQSEVPRALPWRREPPSFIFITFDPPASIPPLQTEQEFQAMMHWNAQCYMLHGKASGRDDILLALPPPPPFDPQPAHFLALPTPPPPPMSTPSPSPSPTTQPLESLSFSDKFPSLQKLLLEMQSNFWPITDITAKFCPEDKARFKALDAGMRRALTIILYWFAFADQLVGDSCADLGAGMADTCIQAAYSWIEAIEKSIHAPTYARLLEFYVDPEGEGRGAKETMQDLVRPKVQAVQDLLAGASQSLRLFVQAAVESILFQLSFRLIVVVRRDKGPQALGLANDAISRDEGDHVKWAAAVYQALGMRVSKEEAWAVVERLVLEEKGFIRSLLGSGAGVPGLSFEEMGAYAEFIGDYVLRLFGIEERWGTANPFPDQASVVVQRVNSFFEVGTAVYQLSGGDVVPDSAYEVDE